MTDLKVVSLTVSDEVPQKTVAVKALIINERVPFRLFQTPCCETLLCWVMPKYPRHCPHCGHQFHGEDIRARALIVDDEAWLRRHGA